MRYALYLLVPGTLLAASAVPTSAPPAETRSRSVETDARETLFDADPQHPWNRLHRLLYSRTTQDGKIYDQEMPGFGRILSDTEVASLLSFVRRRFTSPSDAIAPATVSRVRAANQSRTSYWTVEELQKSN